MFVLFSALLLLKDHFFNCSETACQLAKRTPTWHLQHNGQSILCWEAAGAGCSGPDTALQESSATAHETDRGTVAQTEAAPQKTPGVLSVRACLCVVLGFSVSVSLKGGLLFHSCLKSQGFLQCHRQKMPIRMCVALCKVSSVCAFRFSCIRVLLMCGQTLTNFKGFRTVLLD